MCLSESFAFSHPPLAPLVQFNIPLYLGSIRIEFFDTELAPITRGRVHLKPYLRLISVDIDADPISAGNSFKEGRARLMITRRISAALCGSLSTRL